MDKLKAIMWRYRAGEFGSEPLSMHDILQRAGEPDLFDKMSIKEVRNLQEKACGITKHFYDLILKHRELQGNNSVEERKVGDCICNS